MSAFKFLKKYFLFLIIFTGLVDAQVIPGHEAPELKTKAGIDSHGIDLVSGEAMINGINFSIGNGTSKITITDSSFNGLRTKYKGSITYLISNGDTLACEQLPGGAFYRVSNGNETSVFKITNSTTLTLVRGRGVLSADSEMFIYRDLDGAEYKFEKFIVPAPGEHLFSTASSCSTYAHATMTKVTKPDGEIININYNKSSPSEIPYYGQVIYGHFDSVVSSLGWMFKRDFVSQSGDTTTTVGQTTKNEFSFVNLSQEYCGVGSSVSCRGLNTLWPKYFSEQNYSKVGDQSSFLSAPATISYNGLLTDPNGKSIRLNYSYTKPSAFYDILLQSHMGLIKKYRKKLCGNTNPPVTESQCMGLDAKRVIQYSQGSISFNYLIRSDAGSYQAPVNIVPVTSDGPDGSILYIPVVSSYPYAFYDKLSRAYTHTYTPNWLVKDVGYLSDVRSSGDYDPRGNITTISQVAKNNAGTIVLSSMTYPDESTCSASPKTCNQPTTITDANGVTTVYSYHSQSGYVETITKPAVNGIQAQTRYKYEQKYPYVKNSSGSLVANPPVWVLTEVSECMTQSLNYCLGTADEKRIIYSDFTNNLLSQKTTIQDGTGVIRLETFAEYDIYGNIISVDGPRAGTDDKVFYFYDLMRQKIGEIGIDPDGSGALPRQAARTVYNGDGKVTSIEKGVVYGTSKSDLDAMLIKQQATTEYSTDHGLPIVERFYAAGVLEKVTQKSYDNKLRLDCVARRLNRNTWSSLPASACTLGSTGSEGNDRITKYNYDATGAVLSTISAYGTPLQRVDRTNTYSSVNGMLTTEADGKGNTTFYKHDDFNRLWKTVYPTPSNGTVESTTDYTQTNYRVGSQLVDSVRLRDGLVVNFSEYDALGRVKTKSGALSESFTYNNFNQVLSHTNNTTGGVSQTSSYVFNSLGWVKSESRIAGGVSLGSVSYGYDNFGRRTSLTWPDSFSIQYDYAVNGVAGEFLRKITEANGTLLAEFDYYDNGSRKSLRRGNGVITSYQYNDLQQLKSQATDVGGSNTADDISENFTYALSGQLKTHSLGVANSNYIYTPSSGVTTNYVPDALNRIASTNGVAFTYDGRGNLTQDNTGTTYTYNANNLLLNATKSGVTTTLSYDAENRLHSVIKSGATTKFMYDGIDLIAETNSSNTILRRYVHGPETDDPIVWYEGSGTSDRRYYTANRQGSIVGVTTQSGLSTAVNSYDEYGIQKLNTIGRFQYTGQTWLPEVGLYYYKARLYSPSLGRFMQTDPIGYKDGMNWYSYVGNDPVNSIDPSGMNTISPYQMMRVDQNIREITKTNPEFAAQARNYQLAAGAVLTLGAAAYVSPFVAVAVTASIEAGHIDVPVPVTKKSADISNVSSNEPKLYHRLGDSKENIQQIQQSGELRGNAPKNFFSSDIPKVKAYDGPLPEGSKGFEFTTTAIPDTGHVPGKPTWSAGFNQNVREDSGQAVIQCSVTKTNC